MVRLIQKKIDDYRHPDTSDSERELDKNNYRHQLLRMNQMRHCMEQCILARFALWGLNRRFISLAWPWCHVGCSHPLVALHSDVLVLVLSQDSINVPIFIFEVESQHCNDAHNYVKDQIAVLASTQATRFGSAALLDSCGYGVYDLCRVANKRNIVEITGKSGVFRAKVPIKKTKPETDDRETNRDALPDWDGDDEESESDADSIASNVSVVSATPSDSHTEVTSARYSKNPARSTKDVPVTAFSVVIPDICQAIFKQVMKVAKVKPQMEVVLDAMKHHGFKNTTDTSGKIDCCPPCVMKFEPKSERVAIHQETTKARAAEAMAKAEDEPPQKKQKAEASKMLPPRLGERQNSSSAGGMAYVDESALNAGRARQGGPIIPRSTIVDNCNIYKDIPDLIHRGIEEATVLIQAKFREDFKPYNIGNRERVPRVKFFNNPGNAYNNYDLDSTNTNIGKDGTRNAAMPARPKFPLVDRVWNPVNWQIVSTDNQNVVVTYLPCEDDKFNTKPHGHKSINSFFK